MRQKQPATLIGMLSDDEPNDYEQLRALEDEDEKEEEEKENEER